MLTRLKVHNFKNLDDVDLRFGPFTCIAGPNATGKSNLFDAITFLGALANRPLMEAALAVRGSEARGDVRSIFRKTGEATASKMTFIAEMIIPENGQDELGQDAHASMTFLRYELDLAWRLDPELSPGAVLKVVREEMRHINRGDAAKILAFPHSRKWRDSVVTGERRSAYISMETATEGTPEEDWDVVLHSDAGPKGGYARRVLARTLPRTMLSSVNNAAEHRTLVLARQEMASWTQIQFEPSALRKPDSFTAPRTMAPNGAHLPSALYTLATASRRASPDGDQDLYARISNRLSRLIEHVSALRVDRDEQRQSLSVVITDQLQTEHAASSLSDGTLRFLALAVMESDTSHHGVLCLEEPENGIHPLRIKPIIDLLRDLAVDADLPCDGNNPLRQVIINTHSPQVAAQVAEDELVLLSQTELRSKAKSELHLNVAVLSGTWRSAYNTTIPRGEMLLYLQPVHPEVAPHPVKVRHRRVVDREDLRPGAQQALFQADKSA